MTRSKIKSGIAWLLAVVALVTLTGLAPAQAPSGDLLYPDHHAGVLGDNDITITAIALEAGYWYRIKLDVRYHQNPRTPPGPGDTQPGSYGEGFDFLSDGSPVSQTFTVPLPDCHWQITAGFTLYYSRSGDPTQGDWMWNGGNTPTVDIWFDCPGTPAPAYLTLIKTVINDDGGTLGVGDFPLFIDGFPAMSGTAYPVLANVEYTASETPQSDYAASVWGGDCAEDGTITLALDEDATCTITNDDAAATTTLTLVKTVINDDGGDLQVSDFPLFIDGVAATSGTAYLVLANVEYTASETPQSDYAASVWGGDCAEDGTITLAPGHNKTCYITNNDIPPPLTPVYEIYLPITMKNY